MLKIQKIAIRWTGLAARGNHLGHLLGVAELLDSNGITLPGYTLQIEVKAPIDCDRCLYQFSIMQLKSKRRRRVYQLEICPAGKLSHNGEIVLHGPHEHVGDDVPKAVNGVQCRQWAQALA